MINELNSTAFQFVNKNQGVDLLVTVAYPYDLRNFRVVGTLTDCLNELLDLLENEGGISNTREWCEIKRDEIVDKFVYLMEYQDEDDDPEITIFNIDTEQVIFCSQQM